VVQLAREEHEMATPAVEDVSGIRGRGAAILGAWTLVAMLFAGQAWFAAQVRGEPLSWARASTIWLVWAAAWAALTPAALRLAARFPLRRPAP
jgi:two-component system, LytTR family, sensor kinase